MEIDKNRSEIEDNEEDRLNGKTVTSLKPHRSELG